MLVWLTMTTGARRGELCGLRWSNVDLPNGVLTVRRAIAQYGTERREKDTKTHQQRRLALDPETVKALTEHWERCSARAEALGFPLARDAFVFSLAPDGQEHLVPSSVTQRYSRLARRLGIDTHLHNLRHYSATELIAAGVDVRTVAGRLGHSGGGVTTLRVYAAWLAEADQRASTSLAARAPDRPVTPTSGERAISRPKTPRELLAVELRKQILDGEYQLGDHLPGTKVLAAVHGVAPSTVHRAYALLREWGLLDGLEGDRPRVTRPESPGVNEERRSSLPNERARGVMFRLQIRRDGQLVSTVMAAIDPADPESLRQALLDAVRRRGEDTKALGRYEMSVSDIDGSEIGVFVATSHR